MALPVLQVDRSVGGLVAQQQCVGPLHTPLADVAVVALSHQDTVGAATALGEQPIKSLLDPKVAARLAVTEALTNLVFALVTDLRVSALRLLPWTCRLGATAMPILHDLPVPLPWLRLHVASVMPNLFHGSGCEVQRQLDVGSQAPRGGRGSG